MPKLSNEVSWLDDPNFSLLNAKNGKYTDFQIPATWCVGSQCASSRNLRESSSNFYSNFKISSEEKLSITTKQIDALKSLTEKPIEKRKLNELFPKTIKKPCEVHLFLKMRFCLNLSRNIFISRINKKHFY